jgi:amino acid adenylation domain-containing protein
MSSNSMALKIAERFSMLNIEQQRAVYEKVRQEGMTLGQFPILQRNDSLQKTCMPSYAQTRQWFLWQLEPNSTAYHISGALRLTGDLDITELRDSFAALVARHESLRTVFRSDADGQVKQVIQAHYQQNENELGFRFVDLVNRNVVDGNLVDGDLGERDHSECRLAVQREAAEIQQQPFDLGNGPLLRVSLIKQAEKDYVLVVVMHHIISDGWSMQIIVNEFVAQYRARIQGLLPSLAALPIQYADYAVWQRQWLEAGEKARQLRYWTQQLGSEHPVLALPTDFPRKAEARYGAAHYELALPDALIDSLRRCARDQDATLFMVLLAGFQVLLQRYTGQEDIRVGVPIANRQRTETENVVGFFVNTQVLRSGLDGRTPLNDVLMRVREAALSAQDHQDLPFEQLVDALQPERNMGINPLFQVMYNHQRKDHQALASLPNVTLDNYPLGEQSAQFDLTLDSMETPDGRVKLTFTYAKELFRAQTIERMAGHYCAILEGLAAPSGKCISDLPLLNQSEYQQLMDWGTNAERYDNVKPIHQLIEQQVTTNANGTAVIFNDESLSYGELNVRANQLAHHLIAQGVRPESKVGIAVERSIDMVIGLLGILKAGGAYVPLDPEYPAERLAYMVQDSGIELLLTQSNIKGSVPAQGELKILELDTLDLNNKSILNPQIEIHGGALAYVIYTSGSTGKPKSVGIPHYCLVEHAQVSVGFFGLTSEDRMLQFSTLNFDGCIEQLFPPLLVGSTMVLRGPDLWDSNKFYHELINKQISVVDLTTAYWLLLIQDFAQQGICHYGSLRQVHVGGEAMPPEGIKAWRDAGLAHVKLLNTYGPTEATVTASTLDCESYITTDKPLPQQMPLGEPLAGRALRVLDSELCLVPLGITGELCIGGDLLARGYLKRPGLSAERFVADPFGSEGERLYRTGDLVRWNVMGQLEYLGRIDHQIKIRGLRIELGEIEAQLLTQESIREVVVIAKDSGNGARLVGYVSGDDNIAIDPIELREQLNKLLPEYMVPSLIVVLERLPLNANGKVDRKALPEPEFASSSKYEAPQGDVEQTLAEIWSAVLGVEQVGRLDSFFELGGNSLAAMTVAAKVQQQLGGKIPLSILFEYPVLMNLAASPSLVQLVNQSNYYSSQLDDMEALLREVE